VVSARQAGTFKTYDDWREEQPRRSLLRRYLRRVSTGFRQHLRRAIELAQQAREHGNHPFGALLVDQKETSSSRRRNTVRTDKESPHAETNLMRMGQRALPADFLERMHAVYEHRAVRDVRGPIYWGNVRRIVRLNQEQIRSISTQPENIEAGDHVARDLRARGHTVEVSGPICRKSPAPSTRASGTEPVAQNEDARARVPRRGHCPPIQLTAHTTMTVRTYVQKPSMEKFGAIHSASRSRDVESGGREPSVMMISGNSGW